MSPWFGTCRRWPRRCSCTFAIACQRKLSATYLSRRLLCSRCCRPRCPFFWPLWYFVTAKLTERATSIKRKLCSYLVSPRRKYRVTLTTVPGPISSLRQLIFVWILPSLFRAFRWQSFDDQVKWKIINSINFLIYWTFCWVSNNPRKFFAVEFICQDEKKNRANRK